MALACFVMAHTAELLLPAGATAYLVGGAVRDRLLGLRPYADQDWVVTGTTPEAMLAAGFQPVGKDFPVFLHPWTRQEYALARTERKTAPGYHGFVFHTAPEVRLEDDLLRRDLTINAMAAPPHSEQAPVIDPYGGQQDLQAKVLRHVSPAFAEDPVRILRLARFAARFPEFVVAPETEALMGDMVAAGEVDALVPERVWQELARGLMEAQPARMFEVLRRCGALQRLWPELNRLWGVPQRADYHPEVDTGIHTMMVLSQAVRMGAPLSVRFACLCHDLGKGNTPADILPRHLGHENRSEQLTRRVVQRLRIPNDCAELALLVAHEHSNIHRAADFDAAALLRLIERCDAFRRPQRFHEALQTCEADARGRLGFEEQPYRSRPRLERAFAVAAALPTAPIAAAAIARGAKGEAIAQAIHKARAQAIAQALAEAPAQRSE
ncbi:phosphatase [Vitreoscilla filiformis]|uniref:Multifunctional CCA protein n=2 Tax=Vitreoscilla filiformis TaxID=63 RepID=A0A221KEK0_VITFI|nr:phosphatase [Vitreoscilla filiformis]